MADILINSKFVRATQGAEKTVEELLENLQSSEIKNNEIVTKICLDEIEFDNPESAQDYETSKFSKVSLQVKDSNQLLLQSLNSCRDTIDFLSYKINVVSGLFRGEDLKKANEEFVELIDLLNLFIEITNKSFLLANRNFPESTQQQEQYQQLEANLVTILKTLVTSKVKGDITMLSDVMEYELYENILDWDKKLITKLMMLVQVD